MQKICEVCGASFARSGKRALTARFCSRACTGVGSRLPNKNCTVCGESFKPKAGRPKQMTCSLACAGVLRRTGEERACRWCGQNFYARKARSEASFCSRKCTNEWQGRNKDVYECKMCGIEFKWSASRKAQTNPTYCTISCRDADPLRREMLLRMNAEQSLRLPNKLERDAYAMLDNLGINYEPQYLIGGKFCVDAFVQNAALVIQFDGDYWHGNPVHFPEPNSTQQRRMTMDRSQDAYMAACGYRILRLWESDIRKRPEHVIEVILQTIEERSPERSPLSYAPVAA